MAEPSKLAEIILDQVADAVICINHSGTIIRWNPACTACFGHSSEEALGQNIDLIIPEHLRAAHWSGFDVAHVRAAMLPCVDGSGLARAFFTYAGLGRCCHVFGLLARFT